MANPVQISFIDEPFIIREYFFSHHFISRVLIEEYDIWIDVYYESNLASKLL